MWDKVFGAGPPTLTAWDVGQQYGGGKVRWRPVLLFPIRTLHPCFRPSALHVFVRAFLCGALRCGIS